MKNAPLVTLGLCVLLSACYKAPAPVVQKAPEPDYSNVAIVASTTPFTDWANPAVAEPSASATSSAQPTPTQAPLFARSGATQAAQTYAAALAELKDWQRQNAPQPNGVDPLNNPAPLVAYLNGLGAKISALKAAKEQVEANIEPSEKKRWKEFQKSLEGSDD